MWVYEFDLLLINLHSAVHKLVSKRIKSFRIKFTASSASYVYFYIVNKKKLLTEVREHGVGYYAFSTDDKERHRQQAELKKLREQTKSNQITMQKLKEKRAAQMAARLKAVKRRKKEKLGLPVDSSSGIFSEYIEGK